MIIDYELNAKSRPSERQVWLMSKKAQSDGHTINMSILRAMEKGEVKYYDGVFYKLCRHCMDYKTLDHFYDNQRYTMGKGYICKDCVTTRRRIKAYAVPKYISDSGMKENSLDIRLKLNDENKETLERKLMNNGYAQETDN